MSSKQRSLLLIFGLLILCALLALAAVLAYSFLYPLSPGDRVAQAQLSVSFNAPQSGEQIPVGQPAMVHAVANSDGGITRIELWIDGQLHAAQDSALPEGTSPFPLVAAWQPPAAGAHTLIARAFGADGAQVEAAVDVQAGDETASASDRDGDGVPDEADACPDQPGWRSTNGCPDRDGDTVPDGEDACPDEAGPPESGCPAPATGDRDGDGLPDDEDACPDEAGPVESGGCPPSSDRDGDGVADEEDRCPDAPGLPETDGCPDRDGDTVPDEEDPCPDEAGPPESGCPAPGAGDRDGDGIPDGEDGCPDEPGPAENGGCPVPEDEPGDGPGEDDADSDGDGTPDAADPCPEEPGPPEHDGCPDTDGDGIPDWWDHCPDEPGVPEAAGCPEDDVVGDRDGDGAPDDVDLCPDEPGEPEHGGCPPPEEEEEEPEDFGDADPGTFFEEVPTHVEFQALSFQVSDEYDGVYCYPSLNEGPVERYTFAPTGERQWDIAAELGSRTLLSGATQPIEVQMTCGADNVFMGDGEGWGTYWTIGSVAESHPSSDWDGHVITVRSADGDDGRWFEAQYRLCTDSCEEAAYPTPILGIAQVGGETGLFWQWDGDLDSIRSYDVYMDGARIARLRGESNEGSMTINSYAPLCGNSHEFYLVATGEEGRESPPSNVVTWEADPCPRVVRVTFDAISTFELGGDERWADGNSVGPIGGSFFATGSTSEALDFNAVDYGDWAWERIRGYRLQHTHYYPIQAIFDQIWTWIGGSMSSPYHAPDRDYVTIELGPDDDLTFGGYIYDADSDNPSDTLFDGQHTIPAGEIRPGRYTIWDRNIELTVLVDVIVGPEVGSNPDLTITNIDLHEPSGQLRVHVFNNASDMAEPMDITVHWVPVGSGTAVDSRTWEDVQIASGGSRTLQSGEPPGEIGGMIFVLDPDEAIPDENRGNNTFETPLRMRVEFLDAWGTHCSESGCSIFDCDSEWVFKLWAGYGPSDSDISWIAFHVRFPPSDDLVACSHDACMGHASSDEDWVMEGDERYTFEFDMPAAQNVYVRVTGFESDFWTSNDSFASPLFQYPPRDNWGASSEPYTGYLLAESDCNDAACSECPEQGVRARWRITRVR